MELINFDNEEGGKLDFAEQLQQDWLNACLAADIPAVTRDTAARLLAVLYVHGGGHEEMVMNRKFTNEMRYIQRRYGIEGGQRPDPQVVNLIQHYVTELEQYDGQHRPAEATCSRKDATSDGLCPTVSPSGTTTAPEWAVKLFRDRYGIKLRH